MQSDKYFKMCTHGLLGKAYFHITSSPVEIEMKIFDFTEFGELVCYVLFGGFFVNIRHQNNPTFYSYDKFVVHSVHRSLT